MDDAAGKYPAWQHAPSTRLLQRACRRERRIRFVEDHKEQIKQLHQRTTFPPLSLEALSKMKGQSLKVACAIRDLKVTGNKEVLRERLLNSDSPINKAKRPHWVRAAFACWLMHAAYKTFNSDDDEYDEIGKFGRGSWGYMYPYRKQETFAGIFITNNL